MGIQHWRPRGWKTESATETIRAVREQQEHVLEQAIRARTAAEVLRQAARQFVAADEALMRKVARPHPHGRLR